MVPRMRIAVVALGVVSCAVSPSLPRCELGAACGPTDADWRALAAALTGKLVRPRAPLAPCADAADGDACAAALHATQNPWALEDDPGATQSTGWRGAWTAAPSPYAVAAERAEDVAAAVRFARAHRLRMAVKGTGHDYLGRSTDPGALLVWTHAMRAIEVVDAFVPSGCGGAPTPAVHVGAGARWGEVYREVTVKHRRYVQGGGCQTVGAAGGFLQGGGFGSYSNRYGTAAAGLLEAEVVTADGRVRVVNACRDADLFWALRGGGGGTFGIVTRATLRTHPLPSFHGAVNAEVHARSDEAFTALLARFVRHFDERLRGSAWGEQVQVKPGNKLVVHMTFVGLDTAAAKEAWRPFVEWLDAHKEAYTTSQVQVIGAPGETLWDAAMLDRVAPGLLSHDDRSGHDEVWWSSNQGEVFTHWASYTSRWVPQDRFTAARADETARLLFAASRSWPIELHFNKGQANAADEALLRDRQTAMNPAVYDAVALAIIASNAPGVPGVPGHAPDDAREADDARLVATAMSLLRRAWPRSGAYPNEADYFEPEWQRSFWGDAYGRLLAIKRRYDPDGLFGCHHCVGSDAR